MLTARTRTSTSPRPGTGRGTSIYWRTSGSPYSEYAAAFIVPLLAWATRSSSPAACAATAPRVGALPRSISFPHQRQRGGAGVGARCQRQAGGPRLTPLVAARQSRLCAPRKRDEGLRSGLDLHAR